MGSEMCIRDSLNTTFDPPDWLQTKGISHITSCFAPLKAFAMAFDPNPYAPKAKNMIKYVTAGSSTNIDVLDFQAGDANISGIEVAVSHFSQAWQVSNKDLNSGIRESDLLFANAQELSNSIFAVISTLVNTANFPATPITSAGAAFGLGDAADVYGKVPGTNKALVLHPVNFGRLAHNSGTGFISGEAVHGWKNGIHELSAAGWSGKVRGIGCAPTAVVAVTGTLIPHPWNNIEKRLIGLQGLDLTIEFNSWYDPRYRTAWRSLDCIFGATVGQSDAGVLIVEPN